MTASPSEVKALGTSPMDVVITRETDALSVSLGRGQGSVVAPPGEANAPLITIFQYSVDLLLPVAIVQEDLNNFSIALCDLLGRSRYTLARRLTTYTCGLASWACRTVSPQRPHRAA